MTGVLLERHGAAGKTTIPLDLPIRSGPVVVEAEQPDDVALSVYARARRKLMSELLVYGFGKGFLGRAWTFLSEGRPSQLIVKAKGPWTVRVRHIGSVARLETAASGTGTEVLAYHGPAADAVVDFVREDDPFSTGAIHVHLLPAGETTEKAVEWAVVKSGSGRYPFRVPGPGFLFIRAEGTWTVRLAA